MHLRSLIWYICIPLGTAFNVTSPTPGSTIDISVNNTIKWTTTAGDPPLINIMIQKDGDIHVTQSIATNVSISKSQYVIAAHQIRVTGNNFTMTLQSLPEDQTPFATTIGLFKLVNGTAGSASTNAAVFRHSPLAGGGHAVLGLIIACWVMLA